MENIFIVLALMIISIKIMIYLVEKKKDKISNIKIIDFNTRILGANKEEIKKILGDGTDLQHNSILYLEEWEGIGRVQNIYILNNENYIEEVILNIKNTGLKNEILSKLYSYLGYPYSIKENNNLEWKEDKNLYVFKDCGNILELSISRN